MKKIVLTAAALGMMASASVAGSPATVDGTPSPMTGFATVTPALIVDVIVIPDISPSSVPNDGPLQWFWGIYK